MKKRSPKKYAYALTALILTTMITASCAAKDLPGAIAPAGPATGASASAINAGGETPNVPDPFATVAEINGAPVALGEFQMFFDDVRQITISYFQTAHAAEISGADWLAEYGGERPADYAAALAMENLKPYKTLQKELLDRGVLSDISYEAFYQGWERENRSRLAKKQAGEVIYGPVSYSQRVYYDYLHDQNMMEIKKLIKGSPKESDLRAIYDGNPLMFTLMGEITMRCVSLPQEDFTKTQAEESLIRLKEGLAAGASFDEAAAAAKVSSYSFTRVFTAQDMRTPDVRDYPEIEDAIISLKPGETTGLITNADLEYIYLFCESRQGGGRRGFEDCREELEEMFQEAYFEESFDALVGNARVVIHDEVYQLLTY